MNKEEENKRERERENQARLKIPQYKKRLTCTQ